MPLRQVLSLSTLAAALLTVTGCGTSTNPTAQLTERNEPQPPALEEMVKLTYGKALESTFRDTFNGFRNVVRSQYRQGQFGETQQLRVGGTVKSWTEDHQRQSEENYTYLFATTGGGRMGGNDTFATFDRLFLALVKGSKVPWDPATAQAVSSTSTTTEAFSSKIFGNYNFMGEHVGAPQFRNKPYPDLARAVFRNAVSGNERIKRSFENFKSQNDAMIPQDIFAAVQLVEIGSLANGNRVHQKTYLALLPASVRRGNETSLDRSYGMIIRTSLDMDLTSKMGFVHAFGGISNEKFSESVR